MTTARQDSDAIVIGSGAGGLAAAAHLARAGRRVTVVEREETAGGNLASFTRDGCEFDIGLHYLGSLADGRPAVAAALESLGIELVFRPQDPDGYDELVFADQRFPTPRGIDALRAGLHELFPFEHTEIDRYLRRLQAAGREIEEPLPRRRRDVPAYAWRTRSALFGSFTTLGQLLDHLTVSRRLRAILAAPHMLYGLPPSEVAFTLHAAAALGYVRGAWYPEGGGPALRDALCAVIRADGGEILTGAEVERILVGPDGVEGVRLTGGAGGTAPVVRELRAPVVISSADIRRTFLDLLGPGEAPSRLRRRVAGYRWPLPLFVVYAVIDRDLGAEGLPNRNWLVLDDDDPETTYAALRDDRLPERPPVWITSASLKDPGNPRLCPPGRTNLQLMTLAPAGDAYWSAGTGPRYAERRRVMRDLVLTRAERAIPGIGSAILLEETATPMTLAHRFGATNGTAYGIAATPRQFGAARPAARTPVRGLYLAGASARAGHGIVGALLGGRDAARAALAASSAATAGRPRRSGRFTRHPTTAAR